MRQFDGLLQLIDSFREQQNITVDNLCSGIVSSKTYYNYIRTGNNPPLDILENLMNRLGIDYGMLLQYAFFLRNEDRTIYNYVRRVHCFQTIDTEDSYKKFYDYKLSDEFTTIFLQGYHRKYEWLTKRISLEEYLNALISLITKCIDKQILSGDKNPKQSLLKRVCFVGLLSLYLQASKKSPILIGEYLFTDSEIASAFINLDPINKRYFYLVSLEDFIVKVVKTKTLVEETIITLMNIFIEMTNKTNESKTFEMARCFYKAYIAYVNGDFKMRDTYLVYFYNAVNLITYKDSYQLSIDVLKDTFGDSIIDKIKASTNEVILDLFITLDLYIN